MCLFLQLSEQARQKLGSKSLAALAPSRGEVHPNFSERQVGKKVILKTIIYERQLLESLKLFSPFPFIIHQFILPGIFVRSWHRLVGHLVTWLPGVILREVPIISQLESIPCAVLLPPGIQLVAMEVANDIARIWCNSFYFCDFWLEDRIMFHCYTQGVDLAISEIFFLV